MQKVCKKCGKLLDISYFTKSKMIKDGYENMCKSCRQEQKKKYTNQCEICNRTFKTANKNAKYCSSECIGNSRKNRIIKKCSYCGEEIEVVKNKDGKHEYYYCNQSCRTEHLKILMLGENNPNYAKVEYKCDGCGKTILTDLYKIQSQEHIFCSKKCYKTNIGKFYSGENNNNYNSTKIKCDTCGKEIYRTQEELKKYKNHYCSTECKTTSMKPLLIENNRIKMNKLKVKCAYCGKELEIVPSKLKYKNHIYCSLECKNKGWTKFYSGENSPSWNNNLTIQDRIKGRNYDDYYKWRKQVFERDKYTCKCCGDNKGHNLVAHHIFNYSEHDELKTDINNGITLCATCHKEFHDIYGYTKNNNKQLTTFIEYKKP